MSQSYIKKRKIQTLPPGILAASVYYPRTKHIAPVRNYYEFLQQYSDELIRIEPLQTHEINFRIIEELQKIRVELQTLNARMARIDEQPSVVQDREMPVKEAKEIIASYLKKYFKKHAEVYPSDVADALGMKYERVCSAFALLEKENKLK